MVFVGAALLGSCEVTAANDVIPVEVITVDPAQVSIGAGLTESPGPTTWVSSR
jgi:hypothetical protein